MVLLPCNAVLSPGFPSINLEKNSHHSLVTQLSTSSELVFWKQQWLVAIVKQVTKR